MSRRILAVVALAGAVAVAGACSRGENKQAATVADSLNRDLQLAPVDTSQPLNDRPVAETRPAAAPGATRKPAARPATPTRPRPAASAAAEAPEPAPAAPARAGVSLGAGTVIRAAMVDSINSRHNKAGETVRARVSEDVRGADGRVVIPAGSTITLSITAIHESENKSDKTGTLKLQPQSVTLGGQQYALVGSVESVETQLVGRATNAGDVAKVGAGTAIGAVAGRVIGGSGKGAIIGGIIGGAVGTQRAIETKDRDVMAAPGASVTLRLQETFTAR